jgi:phosphoglycolate phosphatase
MTGHAVFDLDGTLIDSAPMVTDILNGLLADAGFDEEFSPAAVRRFVTVGGRAMVENLVGDRLGDPGAVLAEFRARYATAPTPRDSLYPGAAEAVGELRRRGLALAIFSNKPQALCEKVLADVGLADQFAAVVGSGPDAPHKPDPTGLLLALSRSGGRSERACYIGDSELDQETARRCGVPVVMVTWGYGEPSGAQPQPTLARRFAEVPDLVCSILDRRPAA